MTLSAFAGGAAWQTWLLFRGHPIRIAAWIVIPAGLMLFAMNVSSFWYTGIVAYLIQAMVLKDIRQRVWIWIFVCLAWLTLSTYGTSYLMEATVFLHSELNDSFGPLPKAARYMIQLSTALGAWLIGEATSAVALAWAMPPVESKGLERQATEQAG